MSCSVCFGNFHLKCTDVKSTVVMDWTCSRCLLSDLPLFTCTTEEMNNDTPLVQLREESTDEISQNALRALQEQLRHLKIMHLNTQSMMSTFDEFLLTIDQYPLDIITSSETWQRRWRRSVHSRIY